MIEVFIAVLASIIAGCALLQTIAAIVVSRKVRQCRRAVEESSKYAGEVSKIAKGIYADGERIRVYAERINLGN